MHTYYTFPLCIHSGAVSHSLCLQMRVSWSEQCPPWSYIQGDVEGSYMNEPCCEAGIYIYKRTTLSQVAIYMYKRKIQSKAFTYKCFDLDVHRHERELRHTQRIHRKRTTMYVLYKLLRYNIVFVF